MSRAEKRRQQKLEQKLANQGSGTSRVKPSREQIQHSLDLAVQHHQAGRLVEAQQLYSQILSVDSRNPVALHLLGVISAQAGDYANATDLISKSLKINPRQPKAFYNLGKAWQELGQLQKAGMNYRKAIAASPDYPDPYCNLGNILQEQGKLDDAIRNYRKAISLRPDYGKAHRHLSRVRKYTEYTDDLKAMEEALSLPDLSDEDRMNISFGLGKVWEDLGEYHKSFDFYIAGNAAKRQSFDYSIKADREDFSHLKKTFSKPIFEKHIDSRIKNNTPIFIIGMPRSGTTLIEQILSSHPDVYGAGELDTMNDLVGALDGFPERAVQMDSSELQELGNQYLTFLKKNVGKSASKPKYITDKMPQNFQYVGLLKLILPEAKIIHCIRSPEDTCLSIFKNYFAAEGHFYAYDQAELGHYYNLYRDLMAHWHSVLPGAIYDIHYEQMVADQEAQSRALIEHCGLEWDDACLAFYDNKRSVKTASATQVRQPIYKDSLALWKRYEEQLQPLLKALD